MYWKDKTMIMNLKCNQRFKIWRILLKWKIRIVWVAEILTLLKVVKRWMSCYQND